MDLSRALHRIYRGRRDRTFVTSLAVEFTELTAPSLDTVAVLVTLDEALAATFTVSVMAG